MLLQNQRLSAQYPVRLRGGAIAQERLLWGRSDRLNHSAGSGITDGAASVPNGLRHPSSWTMARKPGGLSSVNEIVASSTVTGAGARGVNGEAILAGAATLAGIGQLVVSATAAIEAQASVSGSIIAALQAAASLSGQGDATGAMAAIGHALAALTGSASLDMTIRATGTLGASIEVGATQALTASMVADEILDAQMVETGLSVRDTLKLCVAALAGKISGASGTTVTIRNAVGDDANRIVATVDASGNRTAITYDLS